MPRTPLPSTSLFCKGLQSELPLNEKEELEQLRKENRVLKSRLKREELGHQAYKLLVELAEETYGIQIRKNSEAK